MKASAEQSDRLHRFAHDLRNRLAAIQQALAQMADASSEERIELIRFAEQQYFKAMRGTEELLDDFAIDRSPRLGELRLLRLDELARKAIAALEHRFSRKRQHVDAENLQAIAVHGDDRMLFDLVSALLSNASKFSEAGSTIALSLTEQDGKTTLELRGGPHNATDAEWQVFTTALGSVKQGLGGTLDRLDAHLAAQAED